ncbi:MAG: hypothetical protein ABIS69_05920 [Sediminibacterium sp.]
MKKITKIQSNNTRQNFRESREVSYWAAKYNTRPAEIETIFIHSGYSISKTLEQLQDKDR